MHVTPNQLSPFTLRAFRPGFRVFSAGRKRGRRCGRGTFADSAAGIFVALSRFLGPCARESHSRVLRKYAFPGANGHLYPGLQPKPDFSQTSNFNQTKGSSKPAAFGNTSERPQSNEWFQQASRSWKYSKRTTSLFFFFGEMPPWSPWPPCGVAHSSPSSPLGSLSPGRVSLCM